MDIWCANGLLRFLDYIAYPFHWILREEKAGMVELRVTMDEKLNKLLDMVVESGVFQSKAELMRSGAVLLLAQMGLLKDHIESQDSRKLQQG